MAEQDKQQVPKKEAIIEEKISTSKDKKWLIHKTVITCIKPVAYYKEVLKSK